MKNDTECRYCKRMIHKDPYRRTIRGEKRFYCSEFCFRLDFYHIPGMDYEGLMDFYKDRTVSVACPDFHSLALAENQKKGMDYERNQ